MPEAGSPHYGSGRWSVAGLLGRVGAGSWRQLPRTAAHPHRTPPRPALRRGTTGGCRLPPLPAKPNFFFFFKKGLPFFSFLPLPPCCVYSGIPELCRTDMRMVWTAHSLVLFTVTPVYAGVASFSTGLNDSRNLVAVQEMVLCIQVI